MQLITYDLHMRSYSYKTIWFLLEKFIGKKIELKAEKNGWEICHWVATHARDAWFQISGPIMVIEPIYGEPLEQTIKSDTMFIDFII